MEEFIRDFLKSNGFTEEDGVWILNKESKSGDQMININGQTFTQPGRVVKITYKMNFLGNGYIENIDGSNHEDFIQLESHISQDDQLVGYFCECFYKDDKDEFVNLMKSVLK